MLYSATSSSPALTPRTLSSPTEDRSATVIQCSESVIVSSHHVLISERDVGWSRWCPLVRCHALYRLPNALGRRRHVDMPNTQRMQSIQHGVDDHRRRRYTATFASTFYTQRIGSAGFFIERQDERWHFTG